MARGAPGASVGTGTATLASAAAGEAPAWRGGRLAPPRQASAPAGPSRRPLSWRRVRRRLRRWPRRALRQRRAWPARRSCAGRLLGDGLLARDRLLGGRRLLLGGRRAAFGGLARLGAAFFTAGRARAGAAAFFAVFLTTGFFTGSPRNGGATFSRKARREGRDRFRPPRIVVTPPAGAAAVARARVSASIGRPVGPPRRQTRHCSRPCLRMSCGRSMPMKTILLPFFSPGAHFGPRSLPISWCTPWKMTLRSEPFMFSTPL